MKPKTKLQKKHRETIRINTRLHLRRFTSIALSLSLLLALVFCAPLYGDIRGSDELSERPITFYGNRIATTPDIEANYSALCTADGRILWSRDQNTSVEIASTTKVMTAVVALEAKNAPSRFTVSEKADLAEGSTANLAAGETLTLKSLLYALMLPSGNDAAVVIAEGIAGDETSYVKLMNGKAKELGMDNTHFNSVNGLKDDDNYSSAFDYAILTKYAMQNETFRKVVKTKTKTLNVNGKQNTLESTNEMLGSYLGANGVKTGFTDAAGYCFIGSAKRNDVELYAIIFDSSSEEQRFDDAEEVLDWGFEHYRNVTLTEANETLANVALTDWQDETAAVCVSEPVTALLFDYDGEITTDVKLEGHAGAINIGDNVGSVDYLLGETVVASANLVSATEMRAPDFFESVGIFFSRIGGFFTGAPANAETEILLPREIAIQ